MTPRLAPLALALLLTLPAHAYIDITPSLGWVVRESQAITLVEVEKVNREKWAVIYRRVDDLKGRLPTDLVRHQLTAGDIPRPPRHLLDWARPGRRAVVFSSGRGGYVCTGQAWYRVAPVQGEVEDGWARMTLDCPELSLSYRGSAARLAGAVREMLAGRTVVVTTVAHGAQGRGAFSDVVFNTLHAGPPAPLQRIRASLAMPRQVWFVGTHPDWYLGLGAVTPDDLPRLTKELAPTDPPDRWTRVDALDDLALLGPQARGPAADRVRQLLQDVDPIVRLHAAAALAAIDPAETHSLIALAREFLRPASPVRTEACHALARFGAKAAPAVPDLLRIVEDDATADADLRITAATTLGLIGSAAKAGVPALEQRLGDRAVRVSAAEALGRLGPAASTSLPALAKLLDDPDPDAQWAAAKAMVLIGGDGARPVVPFLIRRTEAAPRGRELYQLTWLLGLLGPVARDAIPALTDAAHRDNELATMAIWAIAPEDKFPWQIGYRADRPCDLWLFADYIERMGPARTRGAALALLDRLLHDRAGRVPSWGYHLLAVHADLTLPALRDAALHAPATQRDRAARALAEVQRPRQGAAVGN
jgi:HEAT repeat protein